MATKDKPESYIAKSILDAASEADRAIVEGEAWRRDVTAAVYGMTPGALRKDAREVVEVVARMREMLDSSESRIKLAEKRAKGAEDSLARYKEDILVAMEGRPVYGSNNSDPVVVDVKNLVTKVASYGQRIEAVKSEMETIKAKLDVSAKRGIVDELGDIVKSKARKLLGAVAGKEASDGKQ